MKIGAIEAGGTKMVLAIYDENDNMLDTTTYPTETPDITIPKIIDYFVKNKEKHKIDALGVGSFGPVDLNKNSKTYGFITSTPKIAWQNFPLLPTLLKALSVPTVIDTDVNAAVLAEVKMGVAKGCNSAVYVTIGTGIGAGVYVADSLVHGLLHPELGHIYMRPHKDDTLPKGVCPFHEGCLEGLAAGPALGARIQGNAKTLPDDHPIFDIEAYYLAQMCVNLILTLSPEKIILGGGVMAREKLFAKVRQETQRLLNGYIKCNAIINDIDNYIVAPALFPVSGLVGSYLLGKKALASKI